MTPAAECPPPSQTQSPTESEALEVTVQWGHSVLRVVQLSPPRPFVIGDADDADFALDPAALGRERLVLPACDGFTVAGGLTFHARLVQREAHPAPAALLDPAILREHAWVLGSLALHAALLLLFALSPPRVSALAISDVQSARRYIPITTLADAQQTPELQDLKSGEGREGGAAHAGDSGKAGDPKEPARVTRGGVQGPPDTEQVVLAREQLRSQLDRVSILGTIKAASQQYEGLTSIFGAEQAMGRDLEDALSMLPGRELASTRGVFGGLGPRGTGHGGGGRAEGSIGVGEFGTRSGLGRDRYGDGVPLGGPDHKARVPRLRPGKIQAAGGLKKSVIRRIIRRQLPAIRHCYEQSLNTRPDLAGRVAVRFLIDATGVVRAAAVSSSTLGHPATERCVASVVQRLSFPAPAGGSIVKVTYPFTFTRAGG